MKTGLGKVGQSYSSDQLRFEDSEMNEYEDAYIKIQYNIQYVLVH